MRLTSFRIKNFRSIIDSGTNQLAYDNITALIGQNESGKTSILEALTSFYSGDISENVLRSDMSLPEVSCTFSMEGLSAGELLDKNKVPPFFLEIFDKKKHFTLTRTWIDEKNSRLKLDDPEILAIYNESMAGSTKRIDANRDEIRERSKELGLATEKLAQLNADKQETEKSYSTFKFGFEKLEASFKRNTSDNELKSSVEKSKVELDTIKTKLEKLQKDTELQKQLVNKLSEQAKYASKAVEKDTHWENIKNEISSTGSEISKLFEQKEFASSSRKRRAVQKKLDNLNRMLNDLRIKSGELEKELNYALFVYEKIKGGMDEKQAENEARKEVFDSNALPDLEEMGDIFYDKIPVFEFFEDFSSLLPDRIDLEDIINNNTGIEGFKAATNFLKITGLTSDFFNQKNNRILKQKIENLNGEINVDFHEYWQQKIGKENKIKINFELEHYDFQNPEKKGKPYLEFWVKDEKERLYPKQRSRGVRWFLSFYLELKAKAMDEGTTNMLLLIDEPGVSLHARAQEDVLKVFEDIKSKVQVIYTTHSPHLINVDKLYRLLAVQRAKEGDDYSETLVFDTNSLNAASADTLSPIYTLMGTRVSEQHVMQKKNNVIIEDLATYNYLSLFFKLLNIQTDVYFLPASDVTNVLTLVNIMLGWRLEFIVLVDDDTDGQRVYNELKSQMFANNDEQAAKKVLVMDKCHSIEDLFSTIDFKKHILQKREGITESNSNYIRENNLSRSVLVSSFQSHLENDGITFNDFDEETRNNIEWIVNRLLKALNG
jgi:predicted ATP-dependent endonuclease of OLD family